MKINANILRSFVKKSSLNGSMLSINMNFKEDGVHSAVMDAGGVALTMTKLSKNAFEDYNTIGEIFVKDCTQFMKYLNSFDGVVSLELIGDYVLKVWDDNREGNIMLGAEIVCDGVFREERPTITTTIKTNITKEFLNTTMKDVNTLNVNKVSIEADKESVMFMIGSPGETDYFVNRSITPTAGDAAKTAVGSMFVKLNDSLDADIIMLSFGDYTPIVVEESTEHISFACIIAPITGDD